MSRDHILTEEWYLEQVAKKHARKDVGINNAVAPQLQRIATVAGPRFRSKLEQAWANSLEMAKMAGEIVSVHYEPISFKLAAGKRYRPDFMVVDKDGITFHEVKGQWTKNKRDGMTHLKWAAQLYPMFRFVLVMRKRGMWEEQMIQP